MSITSANATYLLSIAGIFPAPLQLQGFAADDVFDTAAIRAAETSMGVDGKLSAGFVYAAVPQNVTLQADSDSMVIFDTWFNQEQANTEKFPATGVIVLTGVRTKWALTKGFLTSFTPMPDAKRVLQPRKFEITWERVSPAAV